MAIQETKEKEACTIKLNMSVSESGTVKTANVSLGSLSANNWDAQKAYNIVEALAPLFSKAVYSVQHIATTNLVDN